MPPEQPDRLEEITPTFEAIRLFGREQVAAERRVELKTMNEIGPLLPATTTHPETVADVALEAVLAAPAYRNGMNKVAERRVSLAAAETASVHVRFAAPALSLDIERVAVIEEARRNRLRVEVPRLSQAATAVVEGLAKIKDAVAFDAAVKALPDVTKGKLRAFETALSNRLGPRVSAVDRAALACVPEQQRKTFEAARETLKVVTRVINTDRQQRIAQEPLAQGQRNDKGISR